MKLLFITLATTACIILSTTSCDRDGNTGNGGNDPTAEFEPAKTIKAAGSNNNFNDTTAHKTATAITVDATIKEGNKY